MGLDIVIYRNNKKNEILEVSEKLHKAIFAKSRNLLELTYLDRINDYYKTNVFFSYEEVKHFIQDLEEIKEMMSEVFKNEIQEIISKLNDNEIVKIHIAGD